MIGADLAQRAFAQREDEIAQAALVEERAALLLALQAEARAVLRHLDVSAQAAAHLAAFGLIARKGFRVDAYFPADAAAVAARTGNALKAAVVVGRDGFHAGVSLRVVGVLYYTPKPRL